jgi:hypothetical protein
MDNDPVDLAAFLDNLECLDPRGQQDAIIEEIRGTGGIWVDPPNDGEAIMISLHGALVMGLDMSDAVRRWRIEARCLVNGYAAPDHRPFHRVQQLDWATVVIDQPYRVSDKAMKSACQIILTHSQDHALRDRADRLCAALWPRVAA